MTEAYAPASAGTGCRVAKSALAACAESAARVVNVAWDGGVHAFIPGTVAGRCGAAGGQVSASARKARVAAKERSSASGW